MITDRQIQIINDKDSHGATREASYLSVRLQLASTLLASAVVAHSARSEFREERSEPFAAAASSPTEGSTVTPTDPEAAKALADAALADAKAQAEEEVKRAAAQKQMIAAEVEAAFQYADELMRQGGVTYEVKR